MCLIKQFIESQRAPDEFEACRLVVRKHFPELASASGGDLEKVAEVHQVEVLRVPGADFEGMIERDSEGRATVSLRKGLNRTRERFTLAHELGHWLLQEEMLGTMKGQLFRGLSKNPSEMEDEERLANLLAAELLMPIKPLTAIFDEANQLHSLRRICREFHVSRTAAIRRLADVCNKNFLLIQIVPFLFDRLESAAEIDDAIFASARRATLFARERTKLLERFSFKDLLGRSIAFLKLKTPKGPIHANFEIDFRSTPIPHIFALASGLNWTTQGHKEGN